MEPYVVARKWSGWTRRVTHRDSGRVLGYVSEHPRCGGPLDNMRSVYLPWSNTPVGQPHRFLHDACVQLLVPELVRPPIVQKRTGRGVALESLDTAIRRCRQEHQDWWQHYDWLVALAGQATAPAPSALAQALALAHWTSVDQEADVSAWPTWPAWSIWRAPHSAHYVAVLEDAMQLWHERGNLLLTHPLVDPGDAVHAMRILRMSLPAQVSSLDR